MIGGLNINLMPLAASVEIEMEVERGEQRGNF